MNNSANRRDILLAPISQFTCVFRHFQWTRWKQPISLADAYIYVCPQYNPRFMPTFHCPDPRKIGSHISNGRVWAGTRNSEDGLLDPGSNGDSAQHNSHQKQAYCRVRRFPPYIPSAITHCQMSVTQNGLHQAPRNGQKKVHVVCYSISGQCWAIF